MRDTVRRITRYLLPALLLVWITGTLAGSRVGQEAPDFSLEPAGGGDSVRLSQFEGKPVLVVFWATWCPPCLQEMPILKKLHEKYGPEGLEILAVTFPYRQTRDGVVKFQKKHGLPFSVLWDEESLSARDYGVNHVPTNVFVDPGGTIRLKGHALTPDLEDLIIRYTAKEE